MEHLGGQGAPPKHDNTGSVTRVSPEVITIDALNHPPPPSKGNDRKRVKTEDTKLTYRMNNRRTKKDYRQELELMNAASDKIMSLNTENAQLRLRLEKAQADNSTLQVALDTERLALQQERRISVDRESSNRTLRLMLLEERARGDARVQNSRLYQGASMAPPPSLPLHAPPILHGASRDPIQDYRLSTARGMYAPVANVPNNRRPPRDGFLRRDAPKPVNQQPFYSQLTAERVRSELASVIERSSE